MSTGLSHGVFAPELIALDADPPECKGDLFAQMAAQLRDADRITSSEEFRAGLEEREAIGSTYMGNGIALPHAKTSVVTTASVVVRRLSSPMQYISHGESGPVTRVFMLAMPEASDEQHLRALAAIARMLVRDEVLEQFDAAQDTGSVVDLLSNHLDTEG